ncbi:MAG: fused MFS/spermidine synthase [Candidatus Berkiellales bacterium]
MLAFSTSIFLSAFLLFIVQPLLAKKLLPWFGGSPAVWLCIVLFFQTALLVGYFYAYLLARIRQLSLQVVIHAALLCLSLLFLPIVPLEEMAALPLWPPIVIFALLSATIILPIVLISSTSPLLQHWYCHTYQNQFPYRYYALSNFGSLLGLLAFPFLLEPFLGLNKQLALWSLCYGAYFLSAGFCLIITLRKGQTNILTTSPKPSEPLTKSSIFSWLILTTLSSALLLSTTQMMMQNVISFPLLWLIPLTLYLLSFIITFSYPKIYNRLVWIIIYALMAGLVLALYTHHQLLLHLQILVFSTLLLSGCMICHGELFKLKPHPEHLTFYYLIIACGGVLGGFFVNLIAPLLFNDWWDFYASLLGVLGFAGYLTFYQATPSAKWSQRILRYSFIFTLVGLTSMLVYHQYDTQKDVVINNRNFFGKSELVEKNPNTEYYQRLLRNGNIIHGHQYLTPERCLTPTTYFSPLSGVGLAMDFERQRLNMLKPGVKVGVIGLGAGTIAALAEKGDFVRFYEIDPDMEKMAKNYFYYLAKTPATTEVVIGDGRMSLARSLQQTGSENYDVLVIDAFNGDAIPLHLLTVEAVKIYLAHLAPNGILTFHVSSRYVDLYPPLQAIADQLGLHAYIAHNPTDDKNWVFSGEWVLISRQSDIGLYLFNKDVLTFNQKRMNKAWTDDHNYLLSVVRW